MKPQFITTETGEELVVLTRRAYDALLAASGDEEAEDRAMARMAKDYLAEEAAGRGADIPFWFVTLVVEHGSTVTAARKHIGLTQTELAAELGISQGQLSDIERRRPHRFLTDAQRERLAERVGIKPHWLL